jgi:hypothetical protein
MKRLVPFAAVAVVLVLASCGLRMPVPTGTGTPTGSASPTPGATVAPPLAEEDVLFTISATLTSPVGATADIEQVVFAPVSTLDRIDEVEARLDEECGDWRSTIGEPAYVASLVTTTDTSKGGKKWPPSGQVVVSLSGFPVFEGDYTGFQNFCSSVQVLIPGTVVGVTPVPASAGSDSRGGWATVIYGFGIATEGGEDPTDERYTQLSDCVITLSEAAEESAIARSWLTAPQLDGACSVNNTGT